jgi:hypothetical protein
MAPWTFNIKFSYDTQFLFRSLMFAAEEDGNLELLTQNPEPTHLSSVYRNAPYYLVDPSTSSTLGGAYSSLNPWARSHYLSSMMSQEYPTRTSIFQPSAGTSSSSSSGASPDRDSIEDYPEIGDSVYWNSTIEAHRISMVGPVRVTSHNSSSRYPTIRGSKASNAQTPSTRIVRNLNSDFNTMRLQTIIESIQCMVPNDSPLIALA